MRLDPNKEAFLIFADSYWDIDNGKSAVELGEQMLVNHVKKERDTAYGYDGYLDETIDHAREFVKNADRDHLVDTLHSLCDIGETDSVARALKNVTLGAIQKSTGVRAAKTTCSGAKITTGLNRSTIKFNGAKVKRSPTKSFNDVVDAPTKAFNQVMADSVNVNSRAKAVCEAAIARKADGLLHNTTRAASTIDIPANRQPNQEKNAVTKFTDDEDTLGGTWTSEVKKEATGRMKGDTVASKTVDIPAMRTPSYSNTRDLLPFEFRGVNPSDVATRLTQGVVDVVNPNGSTHGPIEFNTNGGQPATYRDEGKKTRPEFRGGKAYNGEPQQPLQPPKGDTGSNIESGRGYY
jgi:hypothetical protein